MMAVDGLAYMEDDMGRTKIRRHVIDGIALVSDWAGNVAVLPYDGAPPHEWWLWDSGDDNWPVEVVLAVWKLHVILGG